MTETTSTPAADPAADPAPAPANPYAATPAPATPAPATPAPASATPGFSIASLILGIASIPTGFAVAGIVAIVFGFVARGREPQGRTMANWGIVLGFVGLFGWLIFTIIGLGFALPFLALAPFWF